jgi:hypothetical protein
MGEGFSFINNSVDPYNGDNPLPARYRTSFYGGSDPQFNVPSIATFPDARAGTPTRYIYDFPGAIDVSDLAGSFPVIIRNADTATVMTRVAGSPGVNEYAIVLSIGSERRTAIEFNSAQSGDAIDYDLYILGSTVTQAEFNDINNNSITSTTGNITTINNTTLNTTGTATIGTADITQANIASQGVIVLENQVTTGVSGGGSVSGAWRNRVLNVEVLDSGGHCSLSSDTFTLGAGTYFFTCRTTFFGAQRPIARIYNTSDASVVAHSGQVSDGGTNNMVGVITGGFTIASAKNFNLQYATNISIGSNGLGLPNQSGQTVPYEIYSQITLFKLV